MAHKPQLIRSPIWLNTRATKTENQILYKWVINHTFIKSKIHDKS